MQPHWWSVSPQATKLTSAGAVIALLVYLLVAEPLDLDAVPTCAETVGMWRPGNLLIMTYHGIPVHRPRQMPLSIECSGDLVPGDFTQGGPRCRR